MTDSFALPSKKHFQEICRRLKLNDVQVKVLGGILWRTHLRFMNRADSAIDSDERKRILKLLRKFQVSLDQLLWSLDVSAKDIAKYNRATPVSFETDAGRRATSRVMAVVAGREKLKKDPLQDLVPFAAYGIAGLGDDLLKVKQSIDLIVDVTVRDQGGRPADLVRNFLVKELCKASQKLLKHASTSTAGGAFTELARDVLVDCCGLSDDGLEEIIERNTSSFKKMK